MLHHVMFDIDGTLVQSCAFDQALFSDAVKSVTNLEFDQNRTSYKDVTDAGILNEILQQQGLSHKGETIRQQVKQQFIDRVSSYVTSHPVAEIPGAISFLDYLQQRDDVVVSFATGGWYQSAVLKLDAAGFHYSPDTIASSDDHYKRTEIMNVAKAKFPLNGNVRYSYFGDNSWDREACEQLGFNFILVGDKTHHHQSIADFLETDRALSYIGTSQVKGKYQLER